MKLVALEFSTTKTITSTKTYGITK